jgi:hypothetical protein
MQKKEYQITDEECCKALASRRYKGLKFGTLRRKLADARKPALEAEYKSFVNMLDRAPAELTKLRERREAQR